MSPRGATERTPARLRYGVGGRSVRVLALVGFAAMCVPGSAALAWLVCTAPATHPNDAWMLIGANRVVAAAGVALLGPAFLAGMIAYARRYVRTLDVDTTEGLALARTLLRSEPIPIPIYALIDALGTAPRGISGPAGPIPWASLRVPGRRLPLVLDLAGDFAPPATAWPALLHRHLSGSGSSPAGPRSADRG